jgi:hypothetical protein
MALCWTVRATGNTRATDGEVVPGPLSVQTADAQPRYVTNVVKQFTFGPAQRATAAKSLLGNDFRLTAHRAEMLRSATY